MELQVDRCIRTQQLNYGARLEWCLQSSAMHLPGPTGAATSVACILRQRAASKISCSGVSASYVACVTQTPYNKLCVATKFVRVCTCYVLHRHDCIMLEAD